MKDFRGPLPLDDRHFAEVRRRVLSKIERQPRAPLVLRLAVVAAAVVALFIVFLPHPRTTKGPPVAVHRQTPVVVAPAAAVKIAQAPPTKHPPKRRNPDRIVAVGGPPQESDIYMDIQTSDPNVRIIWIARQ